MLRAAPENRLRMSGAFWGAGRRRPRARQENVPPRGSSQAAAAKTRTAAAVTPGKGATVPDLIAALLVLVLVIWLVRRLVGVRHGHWVRTIGATVIAILGAWATTSLAHQNLLVGPRWPSG